MKLKSFLNKISPGKKKPTDEGPQVDPTEVIPHEISFDRRETKIEVPGAVAEIDVMVNNEKVNIYTLGPVTKIGRDPAQADIIISELIVSKLHCTLYTQDQRYFIQDNDSTNGIYINNQRVIQQEIKSGDIILLGKKGTVRLLFQLRR